MPEAAPSASRFLWGAATSSHQIEGYNDKNDWWAWEAAGHIDGGVKSGAATDHWNRFREDLKLAKDLGLNSYRFSIEWSRLEPQEGRWDSAAFEWYSELISECERLGLKPMLTLHHFTSPQWFAERGGFTWDKAAEKFALFVEEVARRLGPRVPLWCTLNEPMVLVTGTYLGSIMPPARFSPEGAAKACHQLLKAHVSAYDILHSRIQERRGPWKDDPLEVGIAHNMLDFMPDRKWHPIERVLSLAVHRFYNRAWFDAVTGGKQRFGVPFVVPQAEPVPEARNRRSVDFLGVNYYTKAYLQWRPKSASPERPPELPVGVAFARRKEVASDLEWAVHPIGLRRVLKVAASYDLPIYITENGIADREDTLRQSYIFSHLREVSVAIEKGVDIRGYFHWSLLDNFEWMKGFGPRFGLFRVDYDTYARTPTASAKFYKKLIEAHSRYDAQKPNIQVFGKE